MTANLLTLNSSKTELVIGHTQQLTGIVATYTACNDGLIFHEQPTLSEEALSEEAPFKSSSSDIGQPHCFPPWIASISSTTVVHSKPD